MVKTGAPSPWWVVFSNERIFCADNAHRRSRAPARARGSSCKSIFMGCLPRLEPLQMEAAVDVDHLAGAEGEMADRHRRDGPPDVVGSAPATDRRQPLVDQ